jgi:hypothetical protein
VQSIRKEQFQSQCNQSDVIIIVYPSVLLQKKTAKLLLLLSAAAAMYIKKFLLEKFSLKVGFEEKKKEV